MWVIEADWDSPVLSIFLLLSLVLERCGPVSLLISWPLRAAGSYRRSTCLVVGVGSLLVGSPWLGPGGGDDTAADFH